MQIVVDLPKDTFQRVQHFAELTQRNLNEVIVDTLSLSLPSFDVNATHSSPITQLTNHDLLAATELQMEVDEDARLSELLNRQQAGMLSELDRIELLRLMQIYQEGLICKAQALAEAVQRGLLPPITA